MVYRIYLPIASTWLSKNIFVFIFFFMAINIVFMYTDGCKIEKITRWQIHRIDVISYLGWCSFLFNTFTLHKANKSICICAFFRNEQVSNPNTTPFFVLPHIRIFIFVWRILQATFLASRYDSTVVPILDRYAFFVAINIKQIFGYLHLNIFSSSLIAKFSRE